jgi:hypothetical protein
MRGLYYLPFSLDGVDTVRTLVQIVPASTTAFELLRVHISQNNSVASEQLEIEIGHTGVANKGTVTNITPVTFYSGDVADVTAAGTGANATVEPSSKFVSIREVFNTLSGYNHLPIPEERLPIRYPAWVLYIALNTTPASPLNLRGYVVFRAVD